jgi:hypothetical protein
LNSTFAFELFLFFNQTQRIFACFHLALDYADFAGFPTAPYAGLLRRDAAN